jgi:hypothetical protein
MKTEVAKDPNRVFLDERELIEVALARGVREALARHRERGLPVVLEQDGRILWIPAERVTA